MEPKTGRELLLEIKSKIYELEHRISQNEKDSSRPEEKFFNIEKILDRITLNLSTTIKSLNDLISNFKKNQKKKEIIENEPLEREEILNSTSEELRKIKSIISEKNKEIEKLKGDIEQRDIQIEIDKNDIDRTIVHKDQAIFKLIIDLEAKINEINDQRIRINELEIKNSLIQVSPMIIRAIKKAMQYKGFITEHEFADIIDNIYKPKMLF